MAGIGLAVFNFNKARGTESTNERQTTTEPTTPTSTGTPDVFDIEGQTPITRDTSIEPNLIPMIPVVEPSPEEEEEEEPVDDEDEVPIVIDRDSWLQARMTAYDVYTGDETAKNKYRALVLIDLGLSDADFLRDPTFIVWDDILERDLVTQAMLEVATAKIVAKQITDDAALPPNPELPEIPDIPPPVIPDDPPPVIPDKPPPVVPDNPTPVKTRDDIIEDWTDANYRTISRKRTSWQSAWWLDFMKRWSIGDATDSGTKRELEDAIKDDSDWATTDVMNARLASFKTSRLISRPFLGTEYDDYLVATRASNGTLLGKATIVQNAASWFTGSSAPVISNKTAWINFMQGAFVTPDEWRRAKASDDFPFSILGTTSLPSLTSTQRREWVTFALLNWVPSEIAAGGNALDHAIQVGKRPGSQYIATGTCSTGPKRSANVVGNTACWLVFAGNAAITELEGITGNRMARKRSGTFPLRRQGAAVGAGCRQDGVTYTYGELFDFGNQSADSRGGVASDIYVSWLTNIRGTTGYEQAFSTCIGFGNSKSLAQNNAKNWIVDEFANIDWTDDTMKMFVDAMNDTGETLSGARYRTRAQMGF